MYGLFICTIFYLNTQKIEKKYNNIIDSEISGFAKIISFKNEKNYKNKYLIKYKNYRFIVYIDKKEDLKYGDIIYINGNVEKNDTYKNFDLFQYSRYLRQNKIYGIINIKAIEKINEEKDIFYYLETIKIKLKMNLSELFDKEKSGFLAGILIGDKEELTEELSDNFEKSSLSHILALSGLHITYIILGIRFILDLIIKNTRLKNLLTIIFIIFFAIFTGGSPSCLRACIMSSMLLLSKILFRKNDFFTSLLISLDIILIINCYNIENIGMWLSFSATFGLYYINFGNKKGKILEIIKTSISCNLMILPILWNYYNSISLTFFISSIFATIIIGPIIILGYIHLFLGKFSNFFSFIEVYMLNFLFEIAKIIGGLKLSKINVCSVSILFWIIYYLIILLFIFIKRHYKIVLFLSIIRY